MNQELAALVEQEKVLTTVQEELTLYQKKLEQLSDAHEAHFATTNRLLEEIKDESVENDFFNTIDEVHYDIQKDQRQLTDSFEEEREELNRKNSQLREEGDTLFYARKRLLVNEEVADEY
ncbi:DUF3958 family protein [Enterococcus sp. LJL51]|uniref:DUF3958 family protein n=1 Tax=Enterococcus sp. LJL51 TaxID=3416656 RepID=UPI003CF8B809